MMDAIGNTLQGATAIRGSSQQSVNQTAQPEADPLAGSVSEPSRYYSPVVRIDSETQRTVLQFRDGSDGKVLMQYPSEKQLEAYRSKASTERAKEQEKAEAKVTGEKDAVGGASPARTGQQAGSPVVGSAAGESASAKAPASSSAQAAPISVSVPAAPTGASATQSMPSVTGGGGGRPVLQSISA
jgi:hypothetical protein